MYTGYSGAMKWKEVLEIIKKVWRGNLAQLNWSDGPIDLALVHNSKVEGW